LFKRVRKRVDNITASASVLLFRLSIAMNHAGPVVMAEVY